MNLAATANSSVGNKINYYPTYTTPSHTIFNTAMNTRTSALKHHVVQKGPNILQEYITSAVMVNECAIQEISKQVTSRALSLSVYDLRLSQQ
jgi:hypothetical protein